MIKEKILEVVDLCMLQHKIDVIKANLPSKDRAILLKPRHHNFKRANASQLNVESETKRLKRWVTIETIWKMKVLSSDDHNNANFIYIT